MYTVTHPLISAKSGEPVRITFTITDHDGNAVSMTGAAAAYKLARQPDDNAILSLSSPGDITLSSNTAVVEFNTGDLLDGDLPLLGDFIGQLTITKNGDSLVVAEGPLHVAPVIG